MPVTDVALAIDAGGTKLLGGLVSANGTILHVDEVATPRAPEGVDPGLRQFERLATRLVATATEQAHTVRAVGLGFPEYVSRNRVTSTEVFAWDRQPAEVLGAIVPGSPVMVDADVRCAAVAEAAARRLGRGSLFYVSWGTGLSSTWVLDGRAVPGRRGEALALGEWSVAAAVERDWPGNLEQYAAGYSLGRRYADRTGTPADGRGVIGRAIDGDTIALNVVDSAAAALARAIAQVVQLLDPDVVVLGGGLGTSDTRAPRRVAELLPGLLHRPGSPPVEPAVAGPRAGLVGAALVAWAGLGSGSRLRA